MVITNNIIRFSVITFIVHWFLPTSEMLMALEQFSDYKFSPSKILIGAPAIGPL